MRDYYLEYLTKNNENIAESQVSKVSKVMFDDEKQAFDTFDTDRSGEDSKKFCLEDLLENVEMKAQFEFEIEERTAIMIFDGGLSENEAGKLSRENVTQTWFDLFRE